MIDMDATEDAVVSILATFPDKDVLLGNIIKFHADLIAIDFNKSVSGAFPCEPL